MNRFLILFIVAAISFSGCKEIEKLTEFELEYSESFVIPSTHGIAIPIDITTLPIPTNSEAAFSGNNTSDDLIEAIKLNQLDLEVTSPDGGSLSFFKSIEIFILADGLNETRLAWKDAVPEDIGSKLQLDTSDEDLQEYIKGEEFSLRINAEMREAITEDHAIDFLSVFLVDALVLGQ